MLFGSVPSLVSLFRLTVVICCQRKLYLDIEVGVALDVAVRGAKKIRKPFWNASEFSLSTYWTASASLCRSPWVTRSDIPVDNRSKVGQGLNLFYDTKDIHQHQRHIAPAAPNRRSDLSATVDEERFRPNNRTAGDNRLEAKGVDLVASRSGVITSAI